MESFEEVIKDPIIAKFLGRFPKTDWNSVLKKTLKLGIHSMNTVQTLSDINSSPKKPTKNLEIEINHEDDSTDFLAESLVKADGTTPSVMVEEKFIRNYSKIHQKKKKTLSQVNKGNLSRVTPKGKRAKIDFFKDKNTPARVHSLKTKKRQTPRTTKEDRKDTGLDGACVKSFKNLKTKASDILGSPKAKLGIGNSKRSLGINDFKEFYKNNMSCRNYKVDFPLRVKENNESDPFVYVTSSSEEADE